MLLPFPSKLHRRPQRLKPKPPLTLVSATWGVGSWVRLTFDRVVSIGAIDVGVFIVDDNVSSDERFQGAGAATLVDAKTVQVGLVPIGSAHGGSLTLLTAGADSGVVAADDGGAWAGVEDLSLPFPS